MAHRPRLVVCLVLGLLALAGMACNLSGSPQAPAAGTTPAANAPVVDIRVPVNGMSFAEGTNVIIQTVATDSGTGVSRIDLQIDDTAYASNSAPNTAGQSAFMTNFEWQAQGQGLHSLTVIAYRQDGTASGPTSISVNVVAAAPTQQPSATPTVAEPTAEQAEPQAEPTTAPTEPPAPTEDTRPRGTTTIGLNVRRGDSTFHPILGALPNGTEVELLARNAAGTWYVVPFGLSQGWVSGLYLNIAGDTSGLPVQTAPAAPPTALPTAIPATAVPATAVPSGPSVDFRSPVGDGQPYNSGTCFTFFWTTSGGRAGYFDGTGVNGQGQAERCPTASRSYTLHVVFTDGTSRDYSIPVGIK